MAHTKNGTKSRWINCSVLGIDVTPRTKNEFISEILNLPPLSEPFLILGHNLHSTYLFHTNSTMRSVYRRANIVLADGKPVQVDAWLTSKVRGSGSLQCDRIGSTDWFADVIASGAFCRVAVVGAMPDANSALIEQLKQLNTGARYFGFHGENWDADRSSLCVEELVEFGPDFVAIGLGMPLQEEFLARYLDSVPNAVYAAVGGAIDQLSGNQKNAPRWMGNLGLEWLFRLITQPKRLYRRYLLEPWQLAAIRTAQEFSAFILKAKANMRTRGKSAGTN